MASISSIETDSIATTQILSKIVYLPVKLAIKCIQTSRKEKLRKQPMVILCNGCSARHMFCTIFVSSSGAKILEKQVRSSSYQALFFFKENLCSHGKLLKLLEIACWKLCLYRQLFCIRQTSQLSQFYRVSLAELCALLINTFEKLNLINSDANLQPPQHLKLSFLWH